MNRVFWGLWRFWSRWANWSPDWSWFTPKVATILVLIVYAVDWIVLLAVGKRRLMAMLAAAPEPRGMIFRPRPLLQPYELVLLLLSVLCSLLGCLEVLQAADSRRRIGLLY